jgi:hypothetical protein
VILIGGAVMLAGSFLPFYTAPGFTVGTISVKSQSATAWSSGFFGIATVVVVCGVAMAAQIVLSNWTGVSVSPKPFGLRWDQVHLALGFQSAIMMLAFLARDRADLGLGIGFWMMLGAAIVLFVGAVMGAPRRPHLRST